MHKTKGAPSLHYPGQSTVHKNTSYIDALLLLQAAIHSLCSVLIGLFLIGGALQRYCSYAFLDSMGKVHDPELYRSDIQTYWSTVRIFRNAFLFFPVLAVAMLIKIMHHAVVQKKNLREMEKEKFSAEMRLLKAQINP